MKRQHYRQRYVLDGETREVLWVTTEEHGVDDRDDPDGVATTDDGFVPSFAGATQSREWAAARGVELDDSQSDPLDLDALRRWARHPSADRLDCELVLNAWNLFGDLATTLPNAGARFTMADQHLEPTYSKVFYGNNLPAITPPGERYDPTWDREETSAIAALMTAGLDLFRAVVRPLAMP